MSNDKHEHTLQRLRESGLDVCPYCGYLLAARGSTMTVSSTPRGDTAYYLKCHGCERNLLHHDDFE